MTAFGCVPWPVPQHIWLQVETLLQPAVDRGGEVDLADVADELRRGTAQLWVARDDAVIAALVTQAAGDALHLWLCGGGEMMRWLDFMETLKAAARGGGFKRMTLAGRDGWGRILGWRRTADGWEIDL